MAKCQTKKAYMWTRVLNSPFWAIYNMLPFILYKDLHATAFQLAVIVTLKPLVSVLSVYWSAAIEKRPDRLVSNIVWASVLGHVPFLFCPFVTSPWYFILAFGFYMMLARGVVPAWMEVLKLNIPGTSREKVFALASSLGYLGNCLLPLFFGFLLDGYSQAWRFVFPATAILSFVAIIFQLRIPIKKDKIISSSPKNQILQPWKSAWKVVKERADFRYFQWGFMLGGAGLVISQPAIPLFFVDQLKLSYVEMGIAISLCKGVGYVFTTPFWARKMARSNFFEFSGQVTALAALFPVVLLAASFGLSWLYVGYLLYGVMQAGSELSWNLSGPAFAKEEDSSVFSNVNLLMVGIRGAFVPALGSLLCSVTSPSFVIAVGGLLSLAAALHLFFYKRFVAEPQW